MKKHRDGELLEKILYKKSYREMRNCFMGGCGCKKCEMGKKHLTRRYKYKRIKSR